MKLEGKKVVLTGATGGIGNAIAKALDSAGCQLLLNGRNAQKLEELLTSLKGTKHTIVVADLTQHAGIVKLANEATSFNANILINGLGVNKLSVIEATSDDDVNHILTTNLHTPINVCRALLPLLKGQTNASIINIGSILGSIGYAGSTLYCASKFGLRGFTESLRRELADSNINVVYFAPRATNTELNSDEMSKMNDELGNAVDSPDWVAQQLINVLIADKSVNRYLGWPEKFFVRLNALLPSLVDNALSKQLATIKRYCKIAQSG